MTLYIRLAGIRSVDCFTNNNDTPSLATIIPGQMREATFEISVDKSATIKEYALDSEVRYRDSLDNSLISDPMKVRIVVEQENSLLGNPYIIAGILAFVCLIGYLIYHKRTKQ